MTAMGLDEVVGSGRVDRGLVLCDLDGCLIAGDRALPGAARLVATCGDRLWIVSNNSTDTAETLAVRLSCLGLHIPTNRIILAGEETLRALASTRNGMRIALFAADPLLALADDLGLLRTDVDPDVTVLARDPGLTLLRLSRLAALVHRGVPLHLTNPDPSHPGDDGAPVPETGALLAALAAVVPAVSPACLGKPSPDLLRIALARAGAAPADAVFLGDTPQTDGSAARAAGVPFILVARPEAAPAPLSEVAAC
jgi:HAD superfamily hydrolase (TIGR01450 family)